MSAQYHQMDIFCIFYLHLLIADIEHKVGEYFYDFHGISKVNTLSPGFNKFFGLSDTSFVEMNLPLNTIKLITVIVNWHHVFHTSQSHISRKMPLNFTSIDVTEERPTLSIRLRAFDGLHPGFNITVFIVQGKTMM